jgi:hypothetical protein
VYHGFVVLEDVSVEGFTFGAITDFEAEPTQSYPMRIAAIGSIPAARRAGM